MTKLKKYHNYNYYQPLREHEDSCFPEPKFYAFIDCNIFIVYDSYWAYYHTRNVPRLVNEFEKKGMMLKTINDLPDSFLSNQNHKDQIDNSKTFYDAVMIHAGRILIYADSPTANWYKKDFFSYDHCQVQELENLIGQLKDNGIHDGHGVDVPYFSCF